MKIALVAAMANNRVIGLGNHMPWHMPADLAHFKQITLHHPVIMGRKTFTSIGRPLPKRRNIVISRQQDLQIPGVEVFHSLEKAFLQLQEESQVMVIGGQTLFEQTLAQATTLYLTLIAADLAGDTFFPVWNEHEWHLVAQESHAADAKNPYPYRFVEYARIKSNRQA